MIAHRVLPQDLNPKYTISFPSPPKKKKKGAPYCFWHLSFLTNFNDRITQYIYTHTHTHIWMQDRNFTLT